MPGTQATPGDDRLLAVAFRKTPGVGGGEGTLRRAGAGVAQRGRPRVDVDGFRARVAGAR